MNTAQEYAQALVSMHAQNPDTFSFEKFVGLLKQKNHYKMLPAILEQVQKIQSQSESDKSVLIVKDDSVVTDIQSQLDQYKDQFGTDYEIVVDHNIIGGFILKNKTNMVDQSYRSRLMNLYKELVS